MPGSQTVSNIFSCVLKVFFLSNLLINGLPLNFHNTTRTVFPKLFTELMWNLSPNSNSVTRYLLSWLSLFIYNIKKLCKKKKMEAYKEWETTLSLLQEMKQRKMEIRVTCLLKYGCHVITKPCASNCVLINYLKKNSGRTYLSYLGFFRCYKSNRSNPCMWLPSVLQLNIYLNFDNQWSACLKVI